MTDTDNDNSNDNNNEPMSDIECKEEALSGVRNSLAQLQRVPAAGLDADKHELLQEAVSSQKALEKSLSNEVSQIREAESDE